MELEDYVTKKGVRQVKILQHRGVGNTSSLPPVAHQAAAEIVDIINARAIDYTAIDNAREEARKNIMMIKIGFDPREDKACDEAYGAWHGTFRDLFPDATRDAYMERTGLRAALRRRIQTMYNRF